jgi:hypothetical protein
MIAMSFAVLNTNNYHYYCGVWAIVIPKRRFTLRHSMTRILDMHTWKFKDWYPIDKKRKGHYIDTR